MSRELQYGSGRVTGFASNRAGKQCLAGSGQADEENPFRSAGAEADKGFWILEKGDGLLFEFGFVHAHVQRRTRAPRSFAFKSRLSSHVT
jgi:hypothetical protein